MHQPVIYLPQNASLAEVIRTFVRHHIDCLPVVDAAVRVVGLITIEDLVELFLPRYYEMLRDFSVLQDKGQLAYLFDATFPGMDRYEKNLIMAADFMKTHLHWVHTDDSLLQAAACLQSQHLKRLPVVDRDDKLVGLLSDYEVVLALFHGSPLEHTTAARERASEQASK
jgi:CBS domain-containing membrane protein